MTSDVKINPPDYLVLICDDEESIRSMLGEAVGAWGFQVATAPNGEAAYAYLEGGNIPHIILTDIRMGGMTGIELAAKAKQLSSEIEVIIMTSHGTFETAVQAMRIGVFDYISKPFDNIEDVRTTLVHVCERIYLKFYSEYLVNELQRKNREIESLARAAEKLGQNLDVAKSLEIGVQALSEAFDQAPTVFFQYLPQQKSLMATAREPALLFGGAQVKLMLPEEALKNQSALLEHFRGLEKNAEFHLLLEQAWQMNPPDLKVPLSREAATAPWQLRPLITRDVPRGVFASLCHGEAWKAQESPQLLDRYLQTISTAFENALLHAKVVQTAIRDSLTGLFNVRYFKDQMTAAMQAASRLAHPVSLLFFDVDHFKKYNDTHGHPAGDQVLRQIAELMRQNFRGTDVLARYGGEEFVCLLPHTAFVDALEKAETFRRLVEETPFPNEHTQPLGKVTVSIGVSEYPSHGATMEQVIKAADDALYEGKKKSRNTVVAGIPPEGHVPAFESRRVPSREEAGADEKAG